MYLFAFVVVCEYYTHAECKDFVVSDCKQCANYTPHIDKVCCRKEICNPTYNTVGLISCSGWWDTMVVILCATNFWWYYIHQYTVPYCIEEVHCPQTSNNNAFTLCLWYIRNENVWFGFCSGKSWPKGSSIICPYCDLDILCETKRKNSTNNPPGILAAHSILDLLLDTKIYCPFVLRYACRILLEKLKKTFISLILVTTQLAFDN